MGGKHGSISRFPRNLSIRTPSELEEMKWLPDALLVDGRTWARRDCVFGC